MAMNEPLVGSAAPEAPSSVPEQSGTDLAVVVYKSPEEQSGTLFPDIVEESAVEHGIFGPNDINALPAAEIFKHDIRCSLCPYKNKAGLLRVCWGFLTVLIRSNTT